MSEPTGIQRYQHTGYEQNMRNVTGKDEMYEDYVDDWVKYADHVREREAKQQQIDGLLADSGLIEELVIKAGATEYDAHGEPKGPIGLVRDVVKQLTTAHHRINELEAREVDVVLLQQQLAAAQAVLARAESRLAYFREQYATARSEVWEEILAKMTELHLRDGREFRMAELAEYCEQQAQQARARA